MLRVDLKIGTWYCRDPPEGRPSKNRRMPLWAASTRYSLVKGERIVRSVLTARLRVFQLICTASLNRHWTNSLTNFFRCGKFSFQKLLSLCLFSFSFGLLLQRKAATWLFYSAWAFVNLFYFWISLSWKL